MNQKVESNILLRNHSTLDSTLCKDQIPLHNYNVKSSKDIENSLTKNSLIRSQSLVCLHVPEFVWGYICKKLSKAINPTFDEWTHL